MLSKALKILLLLPLMLSVFSFVAPAEVEARIGLDCNREPGAAECAGNQDNNQEKDHWCGNRRDSNGNFDKNENVKTKFNFGCLGEKGSPGLNPIHDLAFAIIRFLSVGAGVVIVLAIILAGIQYTMAEGNPEKSQQAKMRVFHALIGLMIFIFAYSILQFLIPGGIFR